MNGKNEYEVQIMPTMEVDFEVYCGNCGKGVCFNTTVHNSTLTVSCPDCQRNIKTLKSDIKLLKKRISDLRKKK
jgi:endogenous inhibitor of DNA gyrase (YacG/DUF329 family)